MKKLVKLSFLVFIPIVLGITLTLLGTLTENEGVARAGIMVLTYGIPATMFLLVVVGLVMMITGRTADAPKDPPAESVGDADGKPTEEKTDGTEEAPVPEGEREQEEIEEINESYGVENRMRQGEYYSRHLSHIYHDSSMKEKILGWLFFGALMADFALILVFAFLRIPLGTYICFGLFGGTILIAIVVKVIIEKASIMAGKRKGKGKPVCGIVKACYLSSTASVGGVHGRSSSRIVGVVYRVVVTVGDQDYTAYSKNFYEAGEPVCIVKTGKRRAAIIDGESGSEN